MLHQFIQLQRSFPSLHGAPAGSLQHTLRSSIKGSPTADLPLASFKQYKYRENLALKVSNNSEQVLRCKISPILTLLAITKASQHQLFTERQKQEKNPQTSSNLTTAIVSGLLLMTQLMSKKSATYGAHLI